MADPVDDSAVTPCTLLDGRVQLVQPVDGYRVAIDPVLLAACVPALAQGRVLDVGVGTGAALGCVLARCPEIRGTGLEIYPPHAALARRMLALNSWTERAGVVEGDVTARPAPVPGSAFDWVITNPPYHGPGTVPSDAGRAGAHMEAVPLAQWLAFCVRCLAPQGQVAVVHRADRTGDILAALSAEGKVGALTVIPLWPKPGVAAKRVLITGRKGSRAPLTLHPGVVLHHPDGSFTAEAEQILRGGGGVPKLTDRGAGG
ncbi:tRNA1(Val) (adenine(37)-N6)-methyltransferase [Novispirillum itersonii]|uniref:tRNA1(Val) A37 N6-methylase TrmN6 n=1 Tax=Novispirillum itersonii TaxID=189 RepID=A0A7W9ZET8_NOVIT|nr:methyltransferase [Novispirillum itersonii]MBB6209292.1 tRNA1(Val) A37 N6-methylase TrmN6 [Novispirillum itersonii]